MPAPDENQLPLCVGVTVRTPAGASGAFAIAVDDTAGHVTERAVRYFVGRNQLDPGLFGLGLVRGGSIVDLATGHRLVGAEDEIGGIVEGDVLHLITGEPQVDG